MTNLNNEQMKQYLKTIVKLESSINQQTEIVEKAKKGLVKEEIVKAIPFPSVHRQSRSLKNLNLKNHLLNLLKLQ